MQLRDLYVIEMHYIDDTFIAEPGTDGQGPGAQLYGELVGEVTGERVSGAYRASNRARRRMDGTVMPDVHGLIRTTDGAEIFFTQRGYGLPEPVGRRTIVGGILHQTADPRYAWLNSVYAVVEGVVIAQGYSAEQSLVRERVFECVPEPDDL